MVNTTSLFSQVLKVIPRPEFHRLVARFGVERFSKGFSSWGHFVAMTFCHLANARSLREICYGLSCCNGKLRIQIWTALIALLLIKWLHFLSKAGWSFSHMAVMFRMNLFTYRDLKAWLDKPYETPPQPPSDDQLVLGF